MLRLDPYKRLTLDDVLFALHQSMIPQNDICNNDYHDSIMPLNIHIPMIFTQIRR